MRKNTSTSIFNTTAEATGEGISSAGKSGLVVRDNTIGESESTLIEEEGVNNCLGVFETQARDGNNGPIRYREEISI